MKIYVNGVQAPASLSPGSATINSIFSSTSPVRIGAIRPFSGIITGFFKGRIDEVEIFGRALTEAEIRAIFDAGSAGKRKPAGIAPPSGIVSWWPGDGNASDIMDGNHGALSGDAGFAPGKVGQAFSLDGVDDVVEIADSSGLVPGPGGLTIEAWVNPNTGGKIVSDHFGCANWESTELSTSGFIINSSNLSSTRQLLTFATLPLGLWSHIAAVWDGSQMLVYVNGEVVATASAPNPPWDPSAPFVMGGRKTTHDCHGVGTGLFSSEIAGLVDELGYYDRALTEAEIRAIFDAGSAGKRKPASAPIHEVVVPNAQTDAEGNSSNRFPFNTDSAMRYQQVYASGDIGGTGIIDKIAFRPEAFDAGVAFSATGVSVDIRLSHTPVSADGLRATFANNVGLDETVVLDTNSLSYSSDKANCGVGCLWWTPNLSCCQYSSIESLFIGHR